MEFVELGALEVGLFGVVEGRVAARLDVDGWRLVLVVSVLGLGFSFVAVPEVLAQVCAFLPVNLGLFLL